MSAKLTGTALTLLSFCQLSMTCIILDACFPGSGDRQSNQSHFTASLSLYCSSQPPLHLTFCLSSCLAVGLQLQSDLQRFSGSIVFLLSLFFSPFTQFCKWIRKKRIVRVKDHGLYFQEAPVAKELDTPFPGLFGWVNAHRETLPHHLGRTRVGLSMALTEKKNKERERGRETENEMERTHMWVSERRGTCVWRYYTDT